MLTRQRGATVTILHQNFKLTHYQEIQHGLASGEARSLFELAEKYAQVLRKQDR